MNHWIALLIGIVVLWAFLRYEQHDLEHWTREYYKRKRLEREEQEDG